jgi:putative protein kinase ArgK-like GTPase of G3E family
LATAIYQHREFLKTTGDDKRRERERIAVQIEQLLREQLSARLHAHLPNGQYQSMIDSVVDRKIAPQQAVKRMLEVGVETKQA